MSRLLPRARARLRVATKPIAEAAVGALTIGMLRTSRYFDPIKTANLFGRIARSVGPMMREQRIGRFLQPEEVAGLVDYLCSDAAAGVTGQALHIDGGSFQA